jgi:hypothetical protein
MTVEEVDQLYGIVEQLGLREQVIVNLSLIAGLRPGEIFGLRRGKGSRNAC